METYAITPPPLPDNKGMGEAVGDGTGVLVGGSSMLVDSGSGEVEGIPCLPQPTRNNIKRAIVIIQIRENMIPFPFNKLGC